MAVTRTRTQTQWTYHDLDDLPDDLVRYELWEGELIMAPAPVTAHQELVKRILKLFVKYDPDEAKGTYYDAPLDVVLSESISLQPDFLWIAPTNAGIIQPERIMGAPDLVVEVLSPATADADRGRKRGYYASAGVREYWLVDPETRTLTIHALGSQTYTVYEPGAVARSALPELEGLQAEVAGLFADLP